MAVCVALAACDGGTPGGSQTSGPLVSAPVQDARGSAEQQALEAYRGMWRAYAKAGLTANLDEPDLAKYASDLALETLRDGLASYRSQDQVIKGEFGSNPWVVQVSPAADPKAITVGDCLDGTKFLVYTTSGELADDELGGRRSATAMVSNVGADSWKVTSFAVQEVGTC